MIKRVLLLVLLLVSLLLAGGGLARQGCPGPNDPCPPTDPTDPNDPGDPGTQPTQQNQDVDGDGVPDYVDACPNAAGSGFTNGCPVDAATAPPVNTVVFPVSADCLLGNSQAANVREFPSTDEAIVGQIRSGEFARGLFTTRDAQGQMWYFVDGGYVRSDVVRSNGNCRRLPLLQPNAALLHVGSGVIGGLQVFPLQRNLNVLNLGGGLAVSPTGEQVGSLSPDGDIESIAFLVLMQATADMQNDLKTIMDEIKKLNEKEQRERDRIRMTQEAQNAVSAGLDQTAGMLATLQAAARGTMMLVLRHGDAANCPMFTKWLEYPPEIIQQLEMLTPAPLSAPCMVEVLFSDADAARPNPTGDGFDVRLNRLLIDVTR